MSGRDPIDDRPSVPPFTKPPLTFAVQAASAIAATQMQLFANAFAAARNFQDLASILPAQTGEGVDDAPAAPADAPVAKEEEPVIDIERDARIGIDLKIGTLTFEENAQGEFATAIIDVIVGRPDADQGTRVRMEIKVPAKAESDPILAVTEACRRQIVDTLRAAADRLDRLSARDMVFHQPG